MTAVKLSKGLWPKLVNISVNFLLNYRHLKSLKWKTRISVMLYYMSLIGAEAGNSDAVCQ